MKVALGKVNGNRSGKRSHRLRHIEIINRERAIVETAYAAAVNGRETKVLSDRATR